VVRGGFRLAGVSPISTAKNKKVFEALLIGTLTMQQMMFTKENSF